MRWKALRFRRPVIGAALVLPGFLLLAGLIAYPFFMSIYLSMTNAQIRTLDSLKFIGLTNFTSLLDDTIFLAAVRNSFIFTFISVAIKILLGLSMALLLNHSFRGKRVFTSLLLFPWVAPIGLSVLAWVWIFDSLYSPVNWLIAKLGVLDAPVVWLGSKRLAMAAIIVVNAWRGFPFFGIMLYAGLLGIPRSLYEAARVDGATWWEELLFITLPMLRIVLIILTLYSVIFTFSEFTVIHVLTRGGPENATHVFSTLSYQRGIMSGNIGEAAAITLYLFPVFLVVAIGMLRFSWKEREL